MSSSNAGFGPTTRISRRSFPACCPKALRFGGEERFRWWTWRPACERIASNGPHLVGSVSELLDTSRIEAGRMPLQLSTFAIQRLVDEVLEELEPIVGRSRLRVVSKVAPDLKPVRSDRQKIKQ